MTNAAIYLRISQDRDGSMLGIDRQREDCLELCMRHSWPVVEMSVDDDVSAYSKRKKRPGYRALLEALKDGRADAVVAWHPDRLHRSSLELEEFIEIVEAASAHVATVQAGELDLATATGRMTARVVGAVSRHESEHEAERIRRQLLMLDNPAEESADVAHRDLATRLTAGEVTERLEELSGVTSRSSTPCARSQPSSRASTHRR